MTTNIEAAVEQLKDRGFHLYGTNLSVDAVDYRDCDFTGPSAFVLGAEKWGLSENATKLMDTDVFIPMRGMVQSLNVSVATATLLFEALRQREAAGLHPPMGRVSQQRTTTICCSSGPIPTLPCGAANKKGLIQPSTRRGDSGRASTQRKTALLIKI